MHPFVTISGIPGSGKSILLAALAQASGWQSLRFDDFDGLSTQPAEVLESWIAAGMPVERAFIPAFREKALAMVATGPVLAETPFGPLHRSEGLPVTCAIWLDCDPDIALARAFLKEISGEDWQSVRDMRDWAAGYLAAYPAFVSAAIRHQIRTVAPCCDLSLDARRLPEEILAAARIVLNAAS